MNPNDKFEDDLRATLGAAAREPAPERLVSRVSRIPDREPAGGGFLARFGLGVPRMGPGFAAVLGVVVIGLAVVVLRPLADQGLGGPGSSPSSSPDTNPSAVAVVPSENPTPVQVPPSVPPSDVPASATPGPTPTSSTPAVADFDAISVTFASSNYGWLLGSVGCTTVSCPASIVHTVDGGRTWVLSGAPATTVHHDNGLDVGVSVGAKGLRFASREDGWAFGPDLWATHDGGATWTQLNVPGLPANAVVVALETANGVVHAVYYDGSQHFRIATSPIGSDAWTLAPLRIAVGAGPVPAIQLVLSGDTGWVLENDRTVAGGARLVAGTWQSWSPACADVTGPAYLAASSPDILIAVCDVGEWSKPQGTRLFESVDGGVTMHELDKPVPVTSSYGVATSDAETIVVAGMDDHGSLLVGSWDGGQSWVPGLRIGSGTLADLGFTNQAQGVVVATPGGGGNGRLYMTRDDGQTWWPVTF